MISYLEYTTFGRTWTNKVDLYNWWLREIKVKGTEGHRYYCLMMLVIYALKCGVSEEQVKSDAESLLEHFESQGIKQKDIRAMLSKFLFYEFSVICY